MFCCFVFVCVGDDIRDVGNGIWWCGGSDNWLKFLKQNNMYVCICSVCVFEIIRMIMIIIIIINQKGVKNTFETPQNKTHNN